MTTDPCSLITGGTGFAGSHLVEYLHSQSQLNIHVTTLPGSDQTNPSAGNAIAAAQLHPLDLSNKEAIQGLIKELQPTQLYHLAAISEVGSSFKLADKVIINNTLIQLNLLEAIREFSPQTRLVIIGSAQEYDMHVPVPQTGISENHPLGPANPYAVSKVVQDLLALSYHYSYQLDIVRARPFNHIGERQAPVFAIPSFAQQIVAVEQGQQSEIKIGNLDSVRDFTDVKDMVRAYAMLMDKGQTGEVYNIGSGQGVSLKTVLEMLINLSEVPITITTDPAKIRPHDAQAIVADITKIKALGWQPTISLDQTLQRVINSHRTPKER